jgi:hypothetical protein
MRAQLALVAAQVELAVRSHGSLFAYEPERDAGPGPAAPLVRVCELERAVSRAARYGCFRPKCLARSVALHRLLARAGIPGSRIRIGVRRESDALVAHAWVTLEGRIVGDDPSFVNRFTEIADARMASFA